MPELAESTPEEDSKADASNSASLYKVSPARFAPAFHFVKQSIKLSPTAPSQVSDATGSMTLTKVSEKSPFGKELLVRDDCFILDNGANGKIFVWKGEEILVDPEIAKFCCLKCKKRKVIASIWLLYNPTLFISDFTISYAACAVCIYFTFYLV